MTGEVVSVNTALPIEVSWRGRNVQTGIFKNPVSGSVQVRRWNLAGDGQADLTVHGGPDKAVYAYPSEHYACWQGELQRRDLAWGAFGENLTTQGLDEQTVYVGDIFRIGSVVLQVTQPRMPCYKLGVKFGDPSIVKRFLASGRSGFYLSVVTEGALQAGDLIERMETDARRLSIAEMLRRIASGR
jgi:MOSC domain-containing protein YiiM